MVFNGYEHWLAAALCGWAGLGWHLSLGHEVGGQLGAVTRGNCVVLAGGYVDPGNCFAAWHAMVGGVGTLVTRLHALILSRTDRSRIDFLVGRWSSSQTSG